MAFPPPPPLKRPPPPPRPPNRTVNCWGGETKESKRTAEDYRAASEKWLNGHNERMTGKKGKPPLTEGRVMRQKKGLLTPNELLAKLPSNADKWKQFGSGVYNGALVVFTALFLYFMFN